MAEEVDVLVDQLAGVRLKTDAEFTTFMTVAAPALAQAAWLLCGDVARAEELVQHALVKTYLAWPRARVGDPMAYARRILTNTRIDTWRRTRREVLLPDSQMPEAATASSADAHADREELARALARLTPRQRRVVVLRYFLDLPEQQVAADLGVSVGTVKTTSSRALRRLRLILQPAPRQPTPGAVDRGGPQ